ncbi:MAG: hypothetical protein P8X69_13865 [Maritimibacter sp.]
MNRTWLKLALAGLLVVSLSGCKAGADKAAPVRPETYVRVATAELVDYAPNLVLTGSLAARNTVPQQFQLTSRIVSLPVSVGDHVAEGDFVLRFPAQSDPSCTMWFRQFTKTNHKDRSHPHSTEHDTHPIAYELVSKSFHTRHVMAPVILGVYS